MFRALFLATLLATLAVNMIFLFATKDKPPDPSTTTTSTSTLGAGRRQDLAPGSPAAKSQRRLFLRSNDLYDYSAGATPPATSVSGPVAHSSPPGAAGPLWAGDSAPPANNDVDLSTDEPGAKEAHWARQLGANPLGQASTLRLTNGSAGGGHVGAPPRSRLSGVSPRQTNDIANGRQAFRVGQESGGAHQAQTLAPASYRKKFRAKAKTTTPPPPTRGQLARQDQYERVPGQRAPLTNQTAPLAASSDAGHPVGEPGNRGQDNSGGAESARRTLNIRVKSSKNHVLISVDDIVIHESGPAPAPSTTRPNRAGTSEPASGQPARANNLAPTGASSPDELEPAGEARGIHVIVLNQFDGYVMSKRIFDTYSSNQDDELCFYLNMIRDGRILLFAVKDEASFKMAPGSAARRLLQRLGSRHIMELQWRDMWALVVRKSSAPETGARLGEPAPSSLAHNQARMNLAEGLSKSARFTEWAAPVVLETQVELLVGRSDDECPEWTRQADGQPDPEANRRRAYFCSRVEGYGRVCDCQYPAPITFRPAKIENSQLGQVPIVVIASNRPYYLYRMLRSLLAVDGLDPSMVSVFIDGYYEEPLLVSKLFNLRAIQQRPLARRSARISHHYKTSLTATFELFPAAQFAIIFEEDLDVARDALVYFNQTLELLKRDSSLYCVSAWNDQGYEHSSGDAQLVYRIETMPGLGWMLSRRLYKEELEPHWPSADQAHDWDMWIRTQAVRRDRECLIPDVSRTFHFGSTGTNINSYFQRQYFSKHAFNLAPQASFAHLDQLERAPYERLVERLILEGRVVRNDYVTDSSHAHASTSASEFLCSLATTPGGPVGEPAPPATKSAPGYHAGRANSSSNNNNNKRQQQTNVIFIEMIDKDDFKNWLKLAKCWQIWDLDARGQHNSMWRLFLGGRPTMVVGVPASPYSRLKPIGLVPFNL